MKENNYKMNTDAQPPKEATEDRRKVNVGRQLQKKRRELKLSIKEVSDQIRLRPDVIKALEASQFAEMSEPVYTRGFLRTYANYLGLNGQEMVKTLEAQQELPSDREMNMPTPVEEGALPGRGILFVCAGVLLLIGLAWQGASWLTPETGQTLPETARKVAPATTLPETDMPLPEGISPDAAALPEEVRLPSAPFKTPQAVKEAEQTRNAPQAAVPKPIPAKPEGARIRLYAKEDVWVRISDPDAELPVIARVLETGESYWVPPKTGLKLDVGLPPALVVFIDGQKQGISGIIDRRVWNLPLSPDYLEGEYFGEEMNMVPNIDMDTDPQNSASPQTFSDEGGEVDAVVIQDKEVKINNLQEAQ